VVSDKPLSVREARAALEAADEDRRQAVVQELEALSSSEITDVLSWDEMGRVQVRASLSALRLLAKHRGLLEPNSDDRRPSMIGINVKGPDTTTYEIIDEDTQEKE
jgi:hypothetical protein